MSKLPPENQQSTHVEYKVVGVKRSIAFMTLLIVVSLYTSGGWVAELFSRQEGRAKFKEYNKNLQGRRDSSGNLGVASVATVGEMAVQHETRGEQPTKGSGGITRAEAGECSTLERAEYNREWVMNMLKEAGPWPKGWHNTINPSCPKFVAPAQNQGAGIGHRLVAYSMALHTAVWFNVTFSHTSLDGGGGAHGNYNGWDSWLAFTLNEHGFDDVLARPGLKRIDLPGLGGYYQYNEIVISKWKDVLGDPTQCNVLYNMPLDNWAYDVSSTTKFILSMKFSEAMERHLKGAGLGKEATHKSPPMPTLVYDPNAVHVAVHIRIGDQYPTPEHVEARVVRETILPALAAAGLRAEVHVHVFAEKEGAAKFPHLAALPNVHFYPDMPPLDTFYHMTQADFLVGSFSSFSFAAAQVALRPLVYSQPSSDIFRMCGDASVCCMHSGDCWPTAKYRTKLAAERLVALERCGKLAENYEPGRN